MKKIIKEFFPYVLILIGVIFVKTFIVAPVQVNGSSMYTTLHDNDIMLLNKMAYLFGAFLTIVSLFYFHGRVAPHFQRNRLR